MESGELNVQIQRRTTPFLKWAGGKIRLLPKYDTVFPRGFTNYFEPFVGSAAVYFHLYNQGQINIARLSDQNGELINCYRGIRDKVEEVIPILESHKVLHCKEYYYSMRAEDPKELSPEARAARTIYLNKTCFNGLYRVNRSGLFNVPMGRYTNPSIVNPDQLRSASRALKEAHLEVEDFSALTSHVGAGDLVYLDPPYFPLTATANFTSYTAGSFDEAEQRRLAEVIGAISRQGAWVMLSNSDTPLIRSLYSHLEIHTVKAGRAINSNAAKRGDISELVITNYRTN